jgi:hypothetical protein
MMMTTTNGHVHRTVDASARQDEERIAKPRDLVPTQEFLRDRFHRLLGPHASNRGGIGAWNVHEDWTDEAVQFMAEEVLSLEGAGVCYVHSQIWQNKPLWCAERREDLVAEICKYSRGRLAPGMFPLFAPSRGLWCDYSVFLFPLHANESKQSQNHWSLLVLYLDNNIYCEDARPSASAHNNSPSSGRRCISFSHYDSLLGAHDDLARRCADNIAQFLLCNAAAAPMYSVSVHKPRRPGDYPLQSSSDRSCGLHVAIKMGIIARHAMIDCDRRIHTLYYDPCGISGEEYGETARIINSMARQRADDILRADFGTIERSLAMDVIDEHLIAKKNARSFEEDLGADMDREDRETADFDDRSKRITHWAACLASFGRHWACVHHSLQSLADHVRFRHHVRKPVHLYIHPSPLRQTFVLVCWTVEAECVDIYTLQEGDTDGALDTTLQFASLGVSANQNQPLTLRYHYIDNPTIYTQPEQRLCASARACWVLRLAEYLIHNTRNGKLRRPRDGEVEDGTRPGMLLVPDDDDCRELVAHMPRRAGVDLYGASRWMTVRSAESRYDRLQSIGYRTTLYNGKNEWIRRSWDDNVAYVRLVTQHSDEVCLELSWLSAIWQANRDILLATYSQQRMNFCAGVQYATTTNHVGQSVMIRVRLDRDQTNHLLRVAESKASQTMGPMNGEQMSALMAETRPLFKSVQWFVFMISYLLSCRP